MIKLEDIIRNTFSLDTDTNIPDDAGPGGLDGWDSLGHVNLMSELESSYSISINMDEMLGIETVKDIKEILRSKEIKNY